MDAVRCSEEVIGRHTFMQFGRTRRRLQKYSTPPVLDYEELRPKAAGLLTGVDFFRIRDEACSIHYAIVTTRTQVELNLVNIKEI